MSASSNQPSIDDLDAQIDQWVADLGSDNAEVAENAQHGLAYLGPRVLDRVAAALPGLERFGQLCAIEIFTEVGDPGPAAALMEDFAALAPQDRNLARKAFLEPDRAEAGLYGISDAAEFRLNAVMGLRATLVRYPTDPAVADLVDELRDASPDFARLWERHDVQAAPTLTKTFHHPVAGHVTVDCDALTLADRDQHLVLYSAPPGSASAEALAFLNVLGAEAGNHPR